MKLGTCGALRNNGSVWLMVKPKAWKFGSTLRKTFSCRSSKTCSRQARQLSMRLAWVSGTALGSPVVPEVEKITANSSGSGSVAFPLKSGSASLSGQVTQGHPALATASARSFFTAPDSTTSKGRSRFNVLSREASPAFSFSGQKAPPSRHVAITRASVAGQLGIMATSRCPLEKPASFSLSSKASVSVASSAQVCHVPSCQ